MGQRFAEALRRYLSAAEMSQSALARALEVSPQRVADLAAGKKTPGGEVIENIADAIGVPQTVRRELHRAAAKDAGYRIEADA
jgi:transcriptional regulator with XRE-family HTH domain